MNLQSIDTEQPAPKQKRAKPPREQSSKFLTPEQLGIRWQCSLMKLRRMRRKGTLPVTYIERAALYALADVERIEAQARA